MGDATKLIIVGTGGTCTDIVETCLEINKLNDQAKIKILGFLDDNQALHGKSINGLKVLGGLSLAKNMDSDIRFIFAIGSPNNFYKRPAIFSKLGISTSRLYTLVHPSSYISPSAKLAPGVVVLQNVTINSNVRIASNVIILPGSVISHDCNVGSFTLCASNVTLSGNCKVASSCYLGAGSRLIQGVKVGPQSMIGMGANLLKNVVKKSVMVGNPARCIKKLAID